MARYKLRPGVGAHYMPPAEKGAKAQRIGPGEFVDSDDDLSAKHPEKFERVYDSNANGGEVNAAGQAVPHKAPKAVKAENRAMSISQDRKEVIRDEEVKADSAYGEAEADSEDEEELDDEVTQDFDKADEAGVRVVKSGKKFHVYESKSRDWVTEKPISKTAVASLIEDRLEGDADGE